MRDFRMLRRSLLGGMAASAAGALLRPLALHAQTGAAPQRLLLIHRPCGSSSLANGRWFPSGGTTGWTPSPLLSSFTDGKIASLQNQMVVLKGLSSARSMDWLGDQHGAGYLAMLTPPPKDTGTASWPQSASATAATRADPNGKTITPVDQSIDQLLLSQVAALKGACPYPSVQLTCSTESSDQGGDMHALRVTSYRKGAGVGRTTPLWPEPSPATAFKNYFATGLMGLTPEQILRANAQQKSVLDFGLDGLKALQTQAPKSQLAKVQAHIDAIRELEMNLTGSVAAGMCTPPTFAGGPITASPGMFSVPSQQGGYKEVGALDAQTFPIWQQHKEIIKTMFQCDLTRVISFTFGFGNSGVHFMDHVLNDPALVGKYKDANGNAITNPNGHHDVSHNVGAGAADAQFIIDKYYCDRTADLLALLAATPDIGGGTLLDNTLVVFWSEVSDGNAHGIHDLPVVLFGGKFLKLQGGSYLQLGNAAEHAKFTAAGHYPKGPAPYTTDLWTTTAKAFGYDLPAWGDASWNTGAIAGIFA
jgi:Protein of unknown function (DUF1552)